MEKFIKRKVVNAVEMEIPEYIKSLLENYKAQKSKRKRGTLLNFKGVEGRDIYNPTSPFLYQNRIYIAARVEPRESESKSKVMFFKKENDKWVLDKSLPMFDLQDPFLTKIHGEFIFGGVKVYQKNSGNLTYRTVFYKGKKIDELKKFAEGPEGMKDIRLVELPNKKIGVFTRPQGKIGGKGKIGFTIIEKLNELNEDAILKAEILELFPDDVWGGINEVYVLSDKLLGVLGHIAYLNHDKNGNVVKHYYPMTFTFNYITRKASKIEIIATRKDFPKTKAKRSPELNDVVFSGGIKGLEKEIVELYVGLSDICSGKIAIQNPFLKYLKQ